MTYEVLWNIYRGVNIFVRIVTYLILAHCILSWIARPDNGLYRFVTQLVEPILTPFRPLGRWFINKGFRVDLTPIFAILALRLILNLLGRALIYGF